MNSIVTLNPAGQPVTTSLAIAEGVGNPHASVIKLIRQSTSDLEEFGMVGFEIQPKPTGQRGGSDTEYAILNEQHATLLMTYMRNNEVVREFKKRLVRAFYELASRQMMPSLPQSLPEALRLAAELAEEKERLEAEAAVNAPKVAFANQVEVAPDAISVAQAAKIIGTGRQRLFAFLRQIGWVTRRNEPYQCKIEAGYLDVKLGSWEHPDHGLQQSVTALVTSKGLVRLQELWRDNHASAA